MILLPQQFQALVYHFFSGWIFALTWSGMNRLMWHYRRHFVRWVIETLYFFIFVTLMYAGLLPITGGQTQMYLIAVFVLGVAVYLKFYAMTFSPLFERFVGGIVKLLTEFKKQKVKSQAALKHRQETRHKKRDKRRQDKKVKHQKKKDEKQWKRQKKRKNIRPNKIRNIPIA